MTLTRRIAAALALVMTTGTLALGATPAYAAEPSATLAEPPASCPSTYLCVYVNTGYRTDQGYMLMPVRSAGVCEVVNPYRNALSSAWNYSGRNVRFYRDTTCSNDSRILYNGTGNPKFSTHWTPTWDNTVDAIRWG